MSNQARNGPVPTVGPRILECLRGAELTAPQLLRAMGARFKAKSVANATQKLKQAGLVVSVKRAAKLYYRLKQSE